MALTTSTTTLGELLQAKLAQNNLCPEVVEEEEIGTYVSTTTYSALGMTAHKFRVLVAHLAEHSVNLAKSLGADAIAVRGTSGYSVAFAMRMLTSFPIIVARKSGESSHGCSISLVDNGEGNTIDRYLILDDLVDSGTTVKQVVHDLKPAVCVGVLEYCDLMTAINEGYTEPLLPTDRERMVHGISRYGYAF